MAQNDWLQDILQNVQLEQFYIPILEQLQITRLAHFDYVHTDDLEKIGISKPGIRRLQEAVRKKKLQHWKNKWLGRLLGTSSDVSTAHSARAVVAQKPTGDAGLTCLILEKNIVLQEELGTGSFGVVRKGEWKTPGTATKGLPVAVKVLKENALTQPGVFDDFVHEVEAMHSLNHPNLIRLHGVVFHPLMMVCELAPMGALLDYIRAQNGKVSLHLVWKWSEQVAAGMAYLEKNRFLHRDLACRNILLAALDVIKIGDFGLMRALPDSDDCYVMSERRRVPFPWCAPESLRSKQFSHASDVWMFAVALWEMYTFGEDPWMGLNGSEILRLVLREGQRLAAPPACPPDLYLLLMQCWDAEPRERPTFANIVRFLSMNQLKCAVSSLSYRKQGQMTIEAGDSIILIDARDELHWWKGQNQRTLEVGLFPCTLVNLLRNKNELAARKSQTLSPSRKENNLVLVRESGSDEGAAGGSGGGAARRRRTVESRQAESTRAGNTGSKLFNYSKLRNQPAAAATSAVTAKEDLLIDLDLPPSTLSSGSRRAVAARTVSLLDEPIDVPQAFPDSWAASEASPALYSGACQLQELGYGNLQAARSLDSLAPAAAAPRGPPLDPFDTSQLWTAVNPPPQENLHAVLHQPQATQPLPFTQSTTIPRPNYDFNSKIAHQLDEPPQNNLRPRPTYEVSPSAVCLLDPPPTTSQRGLRPNYERSSPGASHYRQSPSTCGDVSQYSTSQRLQSASNNMVPSYSNCLTNSTHNDLRNYSHSAGMILEPVYNNTTNLVTDQFNEALGFSELSLDDKISESLNLSLKSATGNVIQENIYSNDAQSRYAVTGSQPGPAGGDRKESRYSENLASNYANYSPTPQQTDFVLETRDFYTKLSTPAGPNGADHYERNIYNPAADDQGAKLRDFSDTLRYSKNYASVKGSGAEYQYACVAGEDARGEERTYGNVRRYDEVYEASARRPHRPAPPAPAAHSPRHHSPRGAPTGQQQGAL